ncbi:hypothetical protein Achl_4425 (plasmid) [Pseudarthrobacter chlorophenolicus A6]|uniref:Uncharacterized protein n=1 Tax=Pseudarthrobacter chlorophenolicus (strain ATCC 700700 / DSM 12829 / CIP 107037 / JCM 12360 / KCTC 9906 / NCIMB 13794 / A6) TaxID=452863 RepID=B8HIX9_PSECP|nr:hypothetical protein [Pseudarthrobacter chlorophenolicus]ACL42376.1 hypothetical protein Achl_4425 [Pseudarthrobacter chlorophenolicus A6]SDQ17273.1 hypothetical protein SAMN04489738_0482 [Pseudarthrobacter chlorophenolicus]
MAAGPTPLHPAVQFLKDNAVVIGLVLIVAISVAVFAFLQSGQKTEPPAEVKPTVQATAALETAAPTAPASPAAGPGSAPAPTSSPVASAGAQTATGGSPAPTATPRVIGTGPQSVTAKDWKPFASKFAAAWADTAGGKEEWLKRLKPLVSPDLYSGLEVTDIRAVPSDTFDSVSLAEESAGAKTFHAYFKNGGALFDGRVQVQPDGSWLVDQLAPPSK